MRSHCVRAIFLVISALWADRPLHAQGSLTPPGAPAPTQKSLQEIWDKLAAVESHAAALQRQLDVVTGTQRTLLTLGFQDQLPWQPAILEPADNVSGPTSLAFSPSGQPTIAYASGSRVRLVQWNGMAWSASTVDNVPGAKELGNIVFDPDGIPSLVYRNSAQSNDSGVWFARRTADGWDRSRVDGAGIHPSLGFAPDRTPTIAYARATPGMGVHFARLTGTGWSSEAIPGAGDGRSPSLVFSPDGQPMIAFFGENRRIQRARFDGSDWFISSADITPGPLESGPSLAFGPDRQSAITYSHPTALQLQIAHFTSNTWVRRTIDPNPVPGRSSLAFGSDGQPAVAYADATGVRFARFNGSTWVITLVQVGGGNVSLAFGPDGQPAISYHAGSKLHFARRFVPTNQAVATNPL